MRSSFRRKHSLSKILAFTKEKFLALKDETQAKKMSDILRDLIIQPGKQWKDKAYHYNEYCSWLFSVDKQISTKVIDAPIALQNYQYWREKTGLGPESHLYSKATFLDAEEASHPSIPWRVLMPNLRSGHNVGSIIRTVDCFGWAGIDLCGYSPSSDNKSVQGAAMGAQNWVDIRHWDSWEDAFENYSSVDKWALETGPEAQAVDTFAWPQSGLLVLGNEEFGIQPDLLAACDGVVTIPQFGRKASLNVANAFAIAAFQARRN